MSSKRLQQIAIGVVVLLALWGLGALLLRPHNDSLGGGTGSGLAAISEKDVDTLSIAPPGTGTPLVLARTRHGWTANGWKASPQRLKSLFTDLGDTANAELVAQSPAALKRLGVDSAAGYRIRARRNGRTLLDLVVGKSGADYGSAYVRRAGAHDVYLVHSALRSEATRPLNDWRDHTIVRVPADSAHTIQVSTGRRRYTLQRADSAWRFAPTGPKADSATVARMLQDLADVSASGFVTPVERDSARFGRRSRRVIVRGAHGDTLADLALDSARYAYWLRSAGDSVLYKIPLSVGKEITPKESAVKGGGHKG